jgi:hypothetical protein
MSRASVIQASVAIDKTSHTFVVRGFSWLQKCLRCGDPLTTRPFPCGANSVYLSLYPAGRNNQNAGWFAVYVGICSPTGPTLLKSRVQILKPPKLAELETGAGPPPPPPTTETADTTALYLLMQNGGAKSHAVNNVPPATKPPRTKDTTKVDIVGNRVHPHIPPPIPVAATATAAGAPAPAPGATTAAPVPAEDIQESFWMADETAYCYTPDNALMGWTRFTTVEELVNARMIVDDTITIRVDIEIPRLSVAETPLQHPFRQATSVVTSSSTATTTLQTELGHLVSNGLHSDIAICTADGYSLPAHKCLLAARSAPLDALLRSGLREVTDNTLEMPRKTAVVVQAMLAYMYCGAIKFPLTLPDHVSVAGLNVGEMVELFDLACLYDLPGLQDWSADQLSEQMKPDNVLWMMQRMGCYSGMVAAARRFMSEAQQFLELHLSQVVVPTPNFSSSVRQGEEGPDEWAPVPAPVPAPIAESTAPPAVAASPAPPPPQPRKRKRKRSS